MADFVLDFKCDGPTVVKEGIRRQLWRIGQKVIQKGQLYYVVQYWEVTPGLEDNWFLVASSDLTRRYPTQVTEWETAFGLQWDNLHPDRTQDWRPSNPIPKKKRVLDDTPSKSRQDVLKKPKTGTTAQFGASSSTVPGVLVPNQPHASKAMSAVAGSSSTTVPPPTFQLPTMNIPNSGTTAPAGRRQSNMAPPPRPSLSPITPVLHVTSSATSSTSVQRQLSAAQTPSLSSGSSVPSSSSGGSAGSSSSTASNSNVFRTKRTKPPVVYSRHSRDAPITIRPSPTRPSSKSIFDLDDDEDDEDADIGDGSPKRPSRKLPSLPPFKTSSWLQHPLAKAQGSQQPDVDADTSMSGVEDDDDEPIPHPRRRPVTTTSSSSPSGVADENMEEGAQSDVSTESDEADLDKLTHDLPSLNVSPARQRGQLTDYEKVVGNGLTIAYEESQREIEDMIASQAAQSPKTYSPSQASSQPQSPSRSFKISPAPSSFETYSRMIIKAQEGSTYALLMTSMDLIEMPCDKWVEKRKSSKDCSYDDLLFSLWMMMLGWDPLVLKHVARGDLPSEEKSNRHLGKTLRSLKNLTRNDLCPSIYAQYLVNDAGLSPKIKTIKEILDYVDLYARGLDTIDNDSARFAASIDTAKSGGGFGNNTAKVGARRYIGDRKQQNTCEEWVQRVRERIEGLDDEERLDRPLCEIGYATVPTTRLQDHAKHSSSNYLMNLTEAICIVKFPNYKIAQYVVFKLVHMTHAMYAEIIASRIALAYTTQGGGFCHYMAGVSHPGNVKAPDSYYIGLQEQLNDDAEFHDRVHQDGQDFTYACEGLIEAGKEQDAILQEMDQMIAEAEGALTIYKETHQDRSGVLEASNATAEFLKVNRPVDGDAEELH